MKTVAIFCASSKLVAEKFMNDAREVTRHLVDAGCRISYGGGSEGLMGAVAEVALERGAEIVGVIPNFMVDVEWQHKDVKDMCLTKTMSERKQMMIEMADAILALPGSTGTMDELFEALSDKKLGLHGKPVVLLNTAGFYNHLVAQLQLMVDEKFMAPRHLDCLAVANTPEEASRLCLTLPTKQATLKSAAVS